VLPADRVLAGFELRQIVVGDPNRRALAVGRESDLDRARPGGQALGAGMTPADQEPPRALDLEVAPADGDAVDVERELAPGRGSSSA